MILWNKQEEQYVNSNQDQRDIIGENNIAPGGWAIRFPHSTFYEILK